MPTPFEIHANGDQQVRRFLVRATERSRDLRPALNVVADLIAEHNRDQFDRQAGSVSGSWARLSPKYAAWKAKRFPGRKILVLSGGLREDLTVRPFGVEQFTNDTLRVGSTRVYADAHQKGGGPLPARRLELDAAVKTAMQKVIQRWVITGGL